jgi:hypothetical protein
VVGGVEAGEAGERAVVGDEIFQGLVDDVDIGQGGVGIGAGEQQLLQVRPPRQQHRLGILEAAVRRRAVDEVQQVDQVGGGAEDRPAILAAAIVHRSEQGLQGRIGAPEVVTQIKRLQRVYQLTPDDQSMTILLQANLDSAVAILRYDASGFAGSFGAALGGAATAEAIYARARQIHGSVLSIAHVDRVEHAPGFLRRQHELAHVLSLFVESDFRKSAARCNRLAISSTLRPSASTSPILSLTLRPYRACTHAPHIAATDLAVRDLACGTSVLPRHSARRLAKVVAGQPSAQITRQAQGARRGRRGSLCATAG